MTLRGARGRAGETGQALIEAMFVIPFVLVLILLILDFGIALDRREVMVHAVREAARAGANGDDVTAVQAAAVDQSEGNLTAGNVEVCYLETSGDSILGDLNDTIRVKINHQYEMLVGGVGWMGINLTNLNISPTAEAPLLNPNPAANPCS
jgi:Flp pilus assembly protein TadG